MDSFYELTPDLILDSVEMIGKRSTGMCIALNSYENRVYEVEMEDGSRLVAKFYRPNRWTKETILEEHSFQRELEAVEIPVVPPLEIQDGQTLMANKAGILFSLYPKVRGRLHSELNKEQLTTLGRFIGRIHNVGASRPFKHRQRIDPVHFGELNLAQLVNAKHIPSAFEDRYKSITTQIIAYCKPAFEKIEFIRIHGDLHLGNVLWNESSPFIVDFDDIVMGPPCQDIWLINQGRDEESRANTQIMLEGYAQMRPFNQSTLQLIEPLRALRMIHYSAWISRRWEDPSFPRLFPLFQNPKYWSDEILSLQEQLSLIASN